MKREEILKESIGYFIEERLNECYSNLKKNKNYNILEQSYYKSLHKLNEKIGDEEIFEEYEKFKIDMYAMRIEEAYKMGFKDSVLLICGDLK